MESYVAKDPHTHQETSKAIDKFHHKWSQNGSSLRSKLSKPKRNSRVCSFREGNYCSITCKTWTVNRVLNELEFTLFRVLARDWNFVCMEFGCIPWTVNSLVDFGAVQRNFQNEALLNSLQSLPSGKQQRHTHATRSIKKTLVIWEVPTVRCECNYSSKLPKALRRVHECNRGS